MVSMQVDADWKKPVIEKGSGYFVYDPAKNRVITKIVGQDSGTFLEWGILNDLCNFVFFDEEVDPLDDVKYDFLTRPVHKWSLTDSEVYDEECIKSWVMVRASYIMLNHCDVKWDINWTDTFRVGEL